MPAYRPQDLEKKWQAHWQQHHTFRADNQSNKPKYYVLDMFPYPSGAGLHVGHPLGYIASDIVARYQRLQGRNVLHPMGFDSFGLPAEQYAIQTGQHPAVTTEKNIETYIRQLQQLGFSYDWEREVRTSDPSYYKWTQWIFLKLFNSWYNLDTDRAEPVSALIARFAESGSTGIRAAGEDADRHDFTAGQWQLMSEKQKLAAILPYRLAYQQDTYVNWCAALGTVLSNDEVKDGLSERGGYPVERRLMPQWNLRITAYADRLLQGLNTLDWPDAVKEMQRNWIGKSIGAEVTFPVQGHEGADIKVYTTRVDTIYGATFLVLAPEHELVDTLTTPAQRAAVDEYIAATKRRSERDRMSDVKTVSGVFTGAYAQNPVDGTPVPIWLADYVLAGYGTGAVMAVPSGDQRDYLFAKHFDLPIPAISDAQKDLDQQADPTKEGRYINSGIVNGLGYKEATTTLIAYL
ncbi:MAG: leucine--tRNA ligase, partial [Hymenobacter sp.]